MKRYIITIWEAGLKRCLQTHDYTGTLEGARNVAEIVVRETNWNSAGVTYRVRELNSFAPPNLGTVPRQDGTNGGQE